jgi:hypothetical protein
MQVANTKNPSLGGVSIVFGRTGMDDVSGGGSGASAINAVSNASATVGPKNLRDESDSDDNDDDELESVICIQSICILFYFGQLQNKNMSMHFMYATHTQYMQPSHMDALHDVHEKIKMKQEREMHAQQTQPQGNQPQGNQPQGNLNLNHEIRDPHGIMHLLRSRL